MSNPKYDKETVLLEAVRSVLVGDMGTTGNDVETIQQYVNDRVYRRFNRKKVNVTQITINAESGLTNDGIPSGEISLEIDCWVPFDASTPLTTLGQMAARVVNLLDKNPGALNVATSKKLGCRYINKQSSLRTEDSLDQLFRKTTFFRVVCDDEEDD